MTENNQAAASEDDQDVGHVGVGAYVALIITILFFSGHDRGCCDRHHRPAGHQKERREKGRGELT